MNDPGVRVEVIGPEQAHVRDRLFSGLVRRSTFTDERWHTMAGGLPHGDARCLVGYDDQGRRGGGGDGVVGRPRKARVARADGRAPGTPRPWLRQGHHRSPRRPHFDELGSSSAIVCTPSSNVGAVATYKAAGFHPLPEIRDRRRDA